MRRSLAAPIAGALGLAVALATVAAPAAPARNPQLPPEVRAALARAQVPPEAMAVVVQEAGSADAPWLAWQARQPMNPASLFKLVTTLAGLELLGPGHQWVTPVWLDGSVRDGVLDGSLVIKGSGDPKLVVERVWLLLRRVQQMGVREIRGDIVLDRSAFQPDASAPGDFDGEPLRPYNVRPDALVLSYQSVLYTFTPDAARGIARVVAEPALAGVQVDAQVPLAGGACDDWRAGLKATPLDPARMRFGGAYPASCGERTWALAHADATGFASRLLRAMWQEMGGTLGGTVRDGAAPTSPPTFELRSPPLAEVVRDINKFSNNVMAQQLFLTLGLVQGSGGHAESARTVLRRWLAQRLGADEAAGVIVDNGSGLSREGRLSAAALAALLQAAWQGPLMPELLSSLPLAGLDGTLRQTRAAVGRAHLKTGSLRDVVGVAGVVDAAAGRRLVVVALINHDRAQQARPALDALVRWASTAERPPAPQR
ncbi:D-alanyl-D-alanine carboxypeptidase/D-alanyl-D-alanine-endopeptidase [Ideonella sp. A 288]|uniref:D-alanyl-D-alanine carboxypeptidase/D-alanyl-D-alanine endopeptidase n=1 Tax=Ideonella sp. A 288 TaxID=1962181 RepID=UPI000B4AE07D|nr:D-alanyl-D-alanine carboxypeptidase/D-alanyl-D-alanine-endopeptidase [Ideonella sp. A 288]